VRVPGFVHIVDGDASFRLSVERRLGPAGYEVTAYSSAEEFLAQLPSEDVPGCILLDAGLSGLTGLELQARLNEIGFTLPMIFLAASTDVSLTVSAVKAGAHDFLIKSVSAEELLRSVEGAMAQHQLTCNLKSKLDLIRNRLALLTPREGEVLGQIASGKTNKQIGIVLGCTERTVKAHRQKVMEKMQLQTVADLVSLAGRFDIGSAAG
jgi:FixJ family two-component response regulator